MDITLSIPRSGPGESPLNLPVKEGAKVYVLGANGTGKSSLMHSFFVSNANNAQRITAHRQTWFTSNAVSLSPQDKLNLQTNLKNTSLAKESRWKEWNADARPNVAIYDLLDSENIRAREITKAVDANDLDLAKKLSFKDAPIKIVNELLRLSNIPIEISVEQNDRVVATKLGGKPYSIAELSDGERNALLIAAEILTVPKGTLILLDEPERHLHRSIISPLLSLLFSKRPDCAFVVSTHEIELCLRNPSAQTVLVRSCDVSGSQAKWAVDLVSTGDDIDDSLLKDILGSRRTLIFIEGDDKSLDKPLYSLLFPDVSIIAKSGCRDVEQAVTGIRSAGNLLWLRPFGVVDSDRRSQADVEQLKKKGVYALSVYSVESIYYHPDIQKKVAKALAAVTGKDPAILVAQAKADALATIASDVKRLSARALEKILREKIVCALPGKAEIAEEKPVNISIDIAAMLAEERSRFEATLSAGKLSEIIARYPIRETAALSKIAKVLGFQNREQYESAVRTLFLNDGEALKLARSLFGSLEEDLKSA